MFGKRWSEGLLSWWGFFFKGYFMFGWFGFVDWSGVKGCNFRNVY